MKSAPIEAEETGKMKKKQPGGGKKSTRVTAAEHPGGDTPSAVADGINAVTLQS